MARFVEKVVAVAEGLTGLASLLRDEGFQIVNLESGNLQKARAIVVSGVDRNFLGVQRASARVPVIDARGKTEEEVLREVRSRVW